MTGAYKGGQGKKVNFTFFLNPCLYCLERLLFSQERHQILYKG